MRRASTFLTALTLKQNASHIAIEIVTSIKEARYIDVRCLKVAAYTDLKRFTEIVPTFRASLEQDRPNAMKECYFKDVVCIKFETYSIQSINRKQDVYTYICTFTYYNF